MDVNEDNRSFLGWEVGVGFQTNTRGKEVKWDTPCVSSSILDASTSHTHPVLEARASATCSSGHME